MSDTLHALGLATSAARQTAKMAHCNQGSSRPSRRARWVSEDCRGAPRLSFVVRSFWTLYCRSIMGLSTTARSVDGLTVRAPQLPSYAGRAIYIAPSTLRLLIYPYVSPPKTYEGDVLSMQALSIRATCRGTWVLHPTAEWHSPLLNCLQTLDYQNLRGDDRVCSPLVHDK